MYKKQRAKKLVEIYNDAREKNLRGSEVGVQFMHSKSTFYFTDGGMEYNIRINDAAENLEGRGYDQVNKIKKWAENKYD